MFPDSEGSTKQQLPEATLTSNPKSRKRGCQKQPSSKTSVVECSSNVINATENDHKPESPKSSPVPRSPEYHNGDVDSAKIALSLQAEQKSSLLNDSVTASPASKKLASSPAKDDGDVPQGQTLISQHTPPKESTDIKQKKSPPAASEQENEQADVDVAKRLPAETKSVLSSFMKHFSPSRPKTDSKDGSKKRTNRSKPKVDAAKKKEKGPNKLTLTDFFHGVRRSSRKPSSVIQEEKVSALEEAVLTKKYEVDGSLKVVHYEDKGRGVETGRVFQKGDFVVEYAGDLIQPEEAVVRNKQYDDEKRGSYMYYFNHNNRKYCVDATPETERLGRLVNHSRKRPNCQTKSLGINGQPYLILVALRRIDIGEELSYDYGDRSKQSVEDNPWLVNS